MKIKQNTKKLSVKKATIVNLDNTTMKEVKGGCYQTDPRSGCPSFWVNGHIICIHEPKPTFTTC